MVAKSCALFATILCIIYKCGIVTAIAEVSKSYETCIQDEKIATDFAASQTCYMDIVNSFHELKGNTTTVTCTNRGNFTQSFRKAIKTLKNNCGEYIQSHNITTNQTKIYSFQMYNRASFLNQSLHETSLRGFLKANGTGCVRDNINGLLRCIKIGTGYETSVNDIVNTTHSSNYWLRAIDELGWNNASCSITERNKACFKSLLQKNCTEPVVTYITSLFDNLLEACEKVHQPLSLLIKPKPSSPTSSIVIASVLVVMAVGVIGILFKYRHQISSKIKSRRDDERSVEFNKTS